MLLSLDKDYNYERYLIAKIGSILDLITTAAGIGVN
jgi:hypothetical protein